MAEQKFTIGQDSTVELKSKSDITLKLADYNGNVIATEPTGYQLVEGSDVVATMPKVSYYVTAHITAGSYDGVEYADGDYRFELKQLKATGNTTLAPVNTYQWVCTTEGYSRNATAAEIEQFGLTGDNPQISMVLALENADFAYTSENAMPAGTASIYGIKVWQKVEGVTDAIDITETYQTKYTTTDTTNQAVNAGFFAENDKAHTITFANYANAGIVRTDETHIIGNGTTSALGIYVTPVEVLGTEVEGGNDKFYGSKLNETAVSTSADEDFDLGTGRDAITFEKKSGVDTITLNPDEELTLSFDAGATVQHNVVGDDVVLTADVKYYVTAKATENFTYDGISYVSGQTYTFEAKKLTQSGKEGLANTYQWLGTKTRNPNAGENGPVGMVLETSDVEAGSVDEAGVKLSNITVYKSVNGGEGVIVTDDALKSAAAAYNAQISNDVTIKNFAKQDIGATVTLAGDDLANNYTYAAAVSQDKKNITGSRLNDVATSTSLDEKFDLGASVGDIYTDEITFQGDFGKDTVTLNENEKLNLVIKTNDGSVVSPSGSTAPVLQVVGNDVVISSSIKYYVTAKATADFTYDGLNYTKDQVYTFEAKKLTQSGKEGLVDTYQWLGTYTRKANAGENGPVGMVLETSDVEAGAITNANDGGTGVRLGEITVYKSVNGGEGEVVTSDTYKSAANAYAKEASGQITVTGLGKSDIADAVLTINGTDINTAWLNFTPTVNKKGAFVGSRFNEWVDSTSANETFDLKAGTDRVLFAGNFGKDTVKLNPNENLHLSIVGNGGELYDIDSEDIVANISGKNLVLTANVKYYVTAKATADFTYDGLNYTKDQVYTFEAKKLTQSGKEGLVDTYQWLGTYTRKANAGENGPVGMVLETSDVEAGAITNANDGGTGVRLGEITVYKSVNGGEGVAVTGFNEAETAYNNQVNGTITVQDFVTNSSKANLWANTLTPYKYEVTANKNNVFTGTDAGDVATSTDADETFNLKKGSDRINFTGKFGNDTVKLTPGQTLNLDIVDSFDAEPALVFERAGKEGKDVVISTDVKYYVTAKATADFTYDGLEYTKDQVYTFEAKKLTQSGKEGLVDTYQWLGTYTRKANAGENGPVGMVLETSDVALDAITNENDGGTGVRLGEITVYKSVNGGAGVVVDKDTFKSAQTAYNAQVSGQITIQDYSNNASSVVLKINGAPVQTIDKFNELFTVTAADIPVSGKVAPKGNADNNIDAFGFVASPDGKGVTVTTGKGNDVIRGSLFNDTIKTMGGNNTITEEGGTNKITLGKGGSRLMLQEGSSNTVTAKGGENTVALDSYGTNKVTLGAGDDHITVTAGVNNVKAGAGTNEFTVNGTPVAGNEVSNNTYTGGKGVDIVTLNAEKAVNKISAGAGADEITIADGYNTVDGGKGNDTFLVTGGKNILKGGAGIDTFTIQGGNSAINGGAGADTFFFDNRADEIVASVNGGKGNDTYDFSDFTFNGDDSTISIVDTAGKNTLNLSGVEADYDVWFDVSFNKKGKAVASKTLVVQDSDDADQKLTFKTDGKLTKKGAAKGKLANLTVNIGDDVKKVNVAAVTSAVASWLKSEAAGDFTSAADVFKNGSDDQIAALAAIYEDNIFKA